MTSVTTALALAARGWHVFPLRPGDKRPAITCWEERATTDPDRITRCWNTGAYGIGIACGPSRLVVVDLDVPKSPDDTPPAEWAGVRDGLDVLCALADRHRALPDGPGGRGPDEHAGRIGITYTVGTPSGGTHLYYQHPDRGPALRNTTGTLGWKVDTRAHGGYVVAAGTTLAGRTYDVLLDVDPASLPAWLAHLLRPAPPPPQRPVVVNLGDRRRAAYVQAAVDREAARVAEAVPGQRNYTLYTGAVALGQLVAGGALTEHDAITALTTAALRTGLGRLETARTIRSGLKAGTKRPRSVAA